MKTLTKKESSNLLQEADWVPDEIILLIEQALRESGVTYGEREDCLRYIDLYINHTVLRQLEHNATEIEEFAGCVYHTCFAEFDMEVEPCESTQMRAA